MNENSTFSASPRAGFRVLMVDDSETDREIMTRHLNHAWPFERDLTVDWARGGSEALEKMREEQFALLLLDWQMPSVNGAQVLRHVRQNGVRLPVVVVSGLSQEELAVDLESHAAAFLSKDEMNALTFYNAISHALELIGRAPRAVAHAA